MKWAKVAHTFTNVGRVMMVGLDGIGSIQLV
jgi:hypothetical protein